MNTFKYRLVYSQLEHTGSVEEIQHDLIRESIKLLKITDPLEIISFADIPASSGLGSSSTFCVGLLNALYAYKCQRVSKERLAREAAHIEIDILKRPIGTQDHYAAAYGNLNVITFNPDGTTNIRPVIYDPSQKDAIDKNLLLFYTGITRDAGQVLAKQSQDVNDDTKKYEMMVKMKDLVPPLEETFHKGGNTDTFGKLLHENWILKKSLSSAISTGPVDEHYTAAMKAGALGGKLLGAGGGGFLTFYTPPEKHESVRQALKTLYEEPFSFDETGTEIIYYHPD